MRNNIKCGYNFTLALARENSTQPQMNSDSKRTLNTIDVYLLVTFLLFCLPTLVKTGHQRGVNAGE